VAEGVIRVAPTPRQIIARREWLVHGKALRLIAEDSSRNHLDGTDFALEWQPGKLSQSRRLMGGRGALGP
jgi:hypothetical protein